jgi:DNA-binding response OmpR family regulator
VLRIRLVVVVETDDLIRELLKRWLGEAGFDVQYGAAEVGQDDMASFQPDLVIADVPDPRHAGELIRSLQRHWKAPVLLVSARFRRGLARSAATARRFGVSAVLPKPFTREDLLTSVEESIGPRAEPSA